MISLDRISIAQFNRKFTESDSNYIYLVKGDRYWSCKVTDNAILYRWGQDEGAEQSLTVVVEEGKNLGRANETTTSQQAIVEATTKINRKIMAGYVSASASGLLESIEFKSKPTEVPGPMLAKSFNEYAHKLGKYKYVLYQPKLDGIRCIANRFTGELYSRKLERMVIPHLSEAVIELGDYLPEDIEWLDGELYDHDMSFQTITSIVRTQNGAHPDIGKIRYHIYDVVSNLTNEERDDLLSKLSPETPLKIVRSFRGSPEDALKFHQKFVSMGYEGAMLRLPDAPYAVGKRSPALLKIKLFLQEEFAVVGVNKEKFEDNLGTFALVTDTGEPFNARPAFTDAERQEFWDNRDRYDWSKNVATVKFFEWSEDLIPRFPVCLGIRNRSDT
jgi:DNA ligase-1